MKVFEIEQMLKNYKFAKVYLFRHELVVLDTNTYYYRRAKGNKAERLPESPIVYDWNGNLFVGNYKSKESAQEVVQSERENGQAYVIGPVCPLFYKDGSRLRYVQMADLYPDGVGLYKHLAGQEECGN